MLQIGWQSRFFPFSIFLLPSSVHTFLLGGFPSLAVLGNLRHAALGWDSRQQMSSLGQELALGGTTCLSTSNQHIGGDR